MACRWVAEENSASNRCGLCSTIPSIARELRINSCLCGRRAARARNPELRWRDYAERSQTRDRFPLLFIREKVTLVPVSLVQFYAHPLQLHHPPLQPVEEQVDHRRGEQRQHL